MLSRVKMLVPGSAPFFMDYIVGSSFYNLAMKLSEDSRLDPYFQNIFSHPRRVSSLMFWIRGDVIHVIKDWHSVPLVEDLEKICASPNIQLGNHKLSQEDIKYKRAA